MVVAVITVLVSGNTSRDYSSEDLILIVKFLWFERIGACTAVFVAKHDRKATHRQLTVQYLPFLLLLVPGMGLTLNLNNRERENEC